MTAVISIYAHVADPTWDHPTIAWERGFSDATRDRPKRQRQDWSYDLGYKQGKAWAKEADPMRFNPEK